MLYESAGIGMEGPGLWGPIREGLDYAINEILLGGFHERINQGFGLVSAGMTAVTAGLGISLGKAAMTGMAMTPVAEVAAIGAPAADMQALLGGKTLGLSEDVMVALNGIKERSPNLAVADADASMPVSAFGTSMANIPARIAPPSVPSMGLPAMHA